MQEKCVQNEATWKQETQLSREKEVQEAWIRALSREFRVSERPEKMDSNPDHRQKTNIMSGCPQHLDVQKELGWDLVLQETSARKWVRFAAHPKRNELNSRRPANGEKPPEKVVCTPKENWDGNQEASHHLLVVIKDMHVMSEKKLWPWQEQWKDKERTEKKSLRQFVQPENGWSSELWKDWFCAIDNLLCSF